MERCPRVNQQRFGGTRRSEETVGGETPRGLRGIVVGMYVFKQQCGLEGLQLAA